MHLLIDLFMLFAVWYWGDWRNWQKYHTTMIFMAFANMLYNFLANNNMLWTMIPDFLFGYKITEILYTTIVIAGTVLIFLSRFPVGLKKQVIYIMKWIAVYILGEWILFITGRIQYENGWNLGWTLLFDIIMFSSLYLHHKRPILAYVEFAIVTIIGVLYFNIPI